MTTESGQSPTAASVIEMFEQAQQAVEKALAERDALKAAIWRLAHSARQETPAGNDDTVIVLSTTAWAALIAAAHD